jgi:hypothetical protein
MKARFIFFLLNLLTIAFVQSQNIITIDLASSRLQKIVLMNNRKYKAVISNMLYDKSAYTINFNYIRYNIKPLELPANSPKVNVPVTDSTTNNQNRFNNVKLKNYQQSLDRLKKEYNQKLEALKKDTTELLMKEHKNHFIYEADQIIGSCLKKINEIDTLKKPDNYIDKLDSIKNEFKGLINRVELTKSVLEDYVISEKITLNKGDTLTLTIERKGKKWTTTFHTEGEPKSWNITYGFSFVTECIAKSHTYYLDSSFNIIEEGNQPTIIYHPTIMFNWLMTRSPNKLGLSATAGLSLNITKPTIFAGVSLTCWRNINLTLGFATHQVKRLAGEFDTKIPLKQNIDKSKLIQEQYKINPFFSLSFRFAQNPFSTNPK